MVNRVSQQLGNYHLIRLLGQGGFAEVYLGEHIHLNTQAAVKVLHTQLTDKESERFRNEARTIAHLEHPNIVRVLEYGVDGNTPFLIMSYAPNGNLRQRHPQGKQLQLATIVHYVQQVAGALQYVHDQKLIHRDIKPHNMLLGLNDEVLLGDFGLALIVQSSRYQSIQDMAGTVAYMAPEQLQGKPHFASDQYALGVVVYEWLSGDLPFRGAFSEIASQHLLTPPPKLRAKVPTISLDVEEVVMTALAKDPQQRFATVQAFATALEQAYQLLRSPSAVILVNQFPLPVETTTPSSQLSLSSASVNPTDSLGQSPESYVSKDSTLLLSRLSVTEAPVVQQDLSSQPFFPVISPIQPPKITTTVVMPDQSKPHLNLSTGLKKFRRKQFANETSTPGSIALPHMKRRPSLLAITSAIIVVVLLTIVFVGYYAYQAFTATSVIVDISPQMQVINQVSTIMASPNVQTPDVSTASIPDRVFSKTEQASLKGGTTGQVCGVFGVFNCKQAVSQVDVDRLVSQMQPTLENEISQALQKQVTDAGGTITILVNPSIVSETADPPVGSPGNQVTVTLVEQGSTGYIANGDVESVARQLLTQQAQQSWPNYLLISSSITIGIPVIEKLDPHTGQVEIKIAAGGVVEYQFSSAQLQSIENALKNKTVSAARNYLMHLPGINPNTIGIHFTNGGGDTLPGDAQQIKIVTTTPGNLPPVQLPIVPKPTATPSADMTPNATPSPKSGKGN